MFKKKYCLNYYIFYVTNKNSENSIVNSVLRGFKTKSQQQLNTLEKVINNINKIQNDFLNNKLEYLKLKKFSSNDAIKNKKIKNLLENNNLSETDKYQLKVAFAEGYLAGSEKEKIPFKKKFFRLFRDFTLITFIIFIILYNNYNSGSGFKKLFIKFKNEISPEEIDVTFDDVCGIDEAKEELKEIVDFLKDPEKYSRFGGKLPKGVLLVGPPGTGKTLLARAVAGEAGVPFFHAAGAEFDEVLVGQGAKRVRDLFATAKVRAPCVVFIDEIDSVGGKRSNSVLHPYANQTINQLLSEMDGFRQNEGVIVLGATNRRNDLDNALLRPGRFDVEVCVDIPDLSGRKDIFKFYLNKIKLGESIDVSFLARRTIGFSAADIENMCNQAALRAAINNESAVFMKHLDEARDKIIMGSNKKNKIPDDELNRCTAYHEAGHTLVSFYNENSHPVHKVTIIPRGHSLGTTAFIPEKEPYQVSKAQLLAQLDTAMGGRVAEELIFGEEKITTGASNDLKRATEIATAMVKNYGMSSKVGFQNFPESSQFNNNKEISDATLENIELEIKRLLQESYDRAKKTLKNHFMELHLLAEALLKYETLDLDQIKQVVSGKEL